MAVYTKLSESDLINLFSKYNLGKLLNYKEIKEGIEKPFKPFHLKLSCINN